MNEARYHVYILTNKRRTVLYTGVTGDLAARIEAHRTKAVKGFTARYNVDVLVYAEAFDDVYLAITREKRIKGGSRKAKERLIASINPDWRDLSDRI